MKKAILIIILIFLTACSEASHDSNQSTTTPSESSIKTSTQNEPVNSSTPKSNEIPANKTLKQIDHSSSKAGISGYIMKIKDGKILVVSPDAQDFSSKGGVKEFYDAIWFSNAPQNIDLGEKVKVWYDVVEQSYPGLSAVKEIEVISGQKPDGADLTEPEALYRALTSQGINTNSVTVVKSIEYENGTDTWTIKLQDAMDDKILIIQVEDKIK